jgi:hypothetical protein
MSDSSDKLNTGSFRRRISKSDTVGPDDASKNLNLQLSAKQDGHSEEGKSTMYTKWLNMIHNPTEHRTALIDSQSTALYKYSGDLYDIKFQFEYRQNDTGICIFLLQP